MNKRKRELQEQIEELDKEHKKILKAAEEEERKLTSEDGERLDVIIKEIESFSKEIEHLDKREMVRAAGGRDAEESNGSESSQAGEDRGFRSFGEQLQAIATAQLTGVVEQRLVEIRATGLSEGVLTLRG